MQKANFKKDYLCIIEKILKTENDKIYVKWRGYWSDFNSWIDKNTVTEYISIKNEIIISYRRFIKYITELLIIVSINHILLTAVK